MMLLSEMSGSHDAREIQLWSSEFLLPEAWQSVSREREIQEFSQSLLMCLLSLKKSRGSLTPGDSGDEE